MPAMSLILSQVANLKVPQRRTVRRQCSSRDHNTLGANNPKLIQGRRKQKETCPANIQLHAGEGSVRGAYDADQSAQSAGNFFRLHFSVIMMGSRGTFLLCTASSRCSYEDCRSRWERDYGLRWSRSSDRTFAAIHAHAIARSKNRYGHGWAGRS